MRKHPELFRHLPPELEDPITWDPKLTSVWDFLWTIMSDEHKKQVTAQREMAIHFSPITTAERLW